MRRGERSGPGGATTKRTWPSVATGSPRSQVLCADSSPSAQSTFARIGVEAGYELGELGVLAAAEPRADLDDPGNAVLDANLDVGRPGLDPDRAARRVRLRRTARPRSASSDG